MVSDAPTTQVPQRSMFDSKRGRIIQENLTAYLFIAPSLLIIFVFGIFPVAFAFFVSLHRWRRFPEGYRGLDAYVDALGNMAFVVFFWLAIGILIYGLFLAWRIVRRNRHDPRRLLLVAPGVSVAAAVLAFVNWFFVLLPVVLDVPNRLRGQQTDRGVFVNEFLASFGFPEPLAAADTMWLFVLIAIITCALALWLAQRVRLADATDLLIQMALTALALAGGALLLQLTLDEIGLAIAEAREAGESLPIWSQIILISAGAGLMGLALYFWQKVVQAERNVQFFLRGMLVIFLVLGAVLLIMELPQALAEADDDVLQGFNVTVMYSAFSVPIQLALGLGLAVLLFQNIRGRSFYRVMYFLPYITPFVATSAVFALLFSHRSGSPINQFVQALGGEPQTWLLEPKGIFRLIFGEGVPDFLVGPGLALVVIIIFNIWTYAGYSAVIFLAGLGNIKRELYEAARIDGANGWQSFRFVTLPLLSPTTFFLTLIATIGTFQAFTQIFLMRRPGAFSAVDTINIYIYEEIRAVRPDYAYGSAMAFVLFGVILILTLIQNRIVGRRVFYG